MKKPINNFAVVMWVAAAIVALVNVAQIYFAIEAFAHSQTQAASVAFLAIRGFLAAITGTIAPVLGLVGLGALLEIVDQIRWDAKSRKLDTPQNELGH